MSNVGTRQALDRAFAELRARLYVARFGNTRPDAPLYACSPGVSECQAEIWWAGDGDAVAGALSEAGLDVYWDGTPASAMVVRLPPWLPLYRMGKRER